jgi:hypothetical protein
MVFTFAFAIVVTTAITRLGLRMLHLRERRMELQLGSGPAAAEYTEKAERLEARVRVLERLATDRGQDLARSIEDLRTDREPVK